MLTQGCNCFITSGIYTKIVFPEGVPEGPQHVGSGINWFVPNVFLLCVSVSVKQL